MAELLRNFQRPDHPKELRHTLKHLKQHNEQIVRFMVRDLTLRMEGLEMVGNVFYQRGRAARVKSELKGIRLSRRDTSREWFFVWNCYSMARICYAAASGREPELQRLGVSPATVLEKHNEGVQRMRAKRASKGQWTWPHPTSNTEAHNLLVQRYPALLSPADMVDLHANAACAMARFEAEDPAGPLHGGLIEQLHKDALIETNHLRQLSFTKPIPKEANVAPPLAIHL